MKLLKVSIDELYTKEHSITSLILPPSIILCVSDQLNTIKNIHFPSFRKEIEFNTFTHYQEKLYLTSDDGDFNNWYCTLKEFFPTSMSDPFLTPFSGFFLGEENSTQSKIEICNKDWNIASYLVHYTVDNENLVSFYREKIEQKHLT
jgi:hypothetical protein